MNREKAELVVEALRTQLKEEFNVNADLRLSDHHYDNLPVGAWTVSYEGFSGRSPWPYEVTLQSGVAGVPSGVFLEPLNHHSVGIFDYYDI
jgi:hypothetical protein